GTLWEYNDVRVNRLSLSLLRIFREPLADVLRREIMDPIGASRDWQWQPYRSSTVEIDGRRLPSVPSGSHWGGGLRVSGRAHALVVVVRWIDKPHVDGFIARVLDAAR